MLLALSVLALCLGPLLFHFFSRSLNWTRVLDGFLFVSVSWLVLGETLLFSLEKTGPLILVPALVGLVLPYFADRVFQSENVTKVVVVLGMVSLSFHAIVDGVWIAHSHVHSHDSLAIGVILHRIPIGMAIWWIVRPSFGSKLAIFLYGLIAFGTMIGFRFSTILFDQLSIYGFEYFEALVAGSLLHVVLHSSNFLQKSGHHHTGSCPSNQRGWYEGIGNIIGILFLLGLSHFDLHHHHTDSHSYFHNFFGNVGHLFLESAPALILAYAVGGLATVFFKTAYLKWMSSGYSWQQSVKGLVVGLPLPICSCGVVPLYETLVRKGMPPAAAIAFLIATPELGIDAVLISIPLLGVPMTLVRLAGAVFVAIVLGVIIGKMIDRKTKNKVEISEDDKKSSLINWKNRLKSGLKEGFIDLVDHTSPWIVFGVVLAAALSPFLQDYYHYFKNNPLEVAFFAMMGLPMYVCASGATPLVAVFLSHGASAGAALAFLLTGPATNITTFGVLSKLHGRKVAFSLGIGALLLSISAGYMLNAVYTPKLATIEAEVENQHALWEYVFLVALGLLFSYSVFKRGIRSFVTEIFHPHTH